MSVLLCNFSPEHFADLKNLLPIGCTITYINAFAGAADVLFIDQWSNEQRHIVYQYPTPEKGN